MNRYAAGGVERTKWQAWAFVWNDDTLYPLGGKDQVMLERTAIHAAQNATIILHRIVRIGRTRWRMRQ
jgi:hypothetical protein